MSHGPSGVFFFMDYVKPKDDWGLGVEYGAKLKTWFFSGLTDHWIWIYACVHISV